MGNEELSAKLGLDSTDFKTGITALNREIRVLESGFRAAVAPMGDWANTASGLEQRLGNLNKQMDVQRVLIARMKTEYENIGKSSKKGFDSVGAKELEIKINKATEALGKMEQESAKSKTELEKLGQKSKGAGDSLDHLKTKGIELKDVMHGLGSGLKVGMKAIAAVGAAAVAAAGAIGGMVLKAADAAGELVDMSNKTGIGIERLQEMDFVGKQLGVSTDTMAGAFSRLTKNMGQSLDGSGEAFDAFKRLGIPVVDMNGNLRDSEDVFQDALDALGGVSNETERDTLAMALFGKSAQDLNGLIEADSDEIANLTKMAHEMGAVMKKEDVEALEAFGDEMEGLKGGAKGMMGTLAAAFLPGFRGITGAAKGYMKDLSQILSGSDGDLGKMAEGIGGLLGKIIGDIAKKLPEIMDAGLGILQGLINAIVQNLPVMIPAIISIINAIVQFIAQNLPLVIGAALMIVMALANGLISNLPTLITAAIQLIVTLALGIAKALPELMPTIAKIIPEIIITLIDSLPLLLDAALQLIMALVDGLIVALPVLLASVPQIMTALIDAFTLMWPMIVETGKRMIDQITTGIKNAWPGMVASGKSIGSIWINGVLENLSMMRNVGNQIVDAVWGGIKEKATWFYNQVKDFFTGLINAVKDALDWHSPPGKFVEIGKGMANALGLGWNSAFSGIERDINNAIGALNPTINPTLAGAGISGFGGSPAPVNSVTVNASVANQIDIYKLAYQVADVIQRKRS